ncbi:UDP-2,3-diacylglucosamine diphosphatase [Xylophilus sp. GOD-11R]|uniref:UDP-2,3-diacylglucosamine diphosphatase n=1 Tax=Xylophilus sp. GOD-11R TaxID=3089814 RepID=UPI00298C12E3|nr:UDP-2,3-diacylglucosamine diphosphatase [Xylophilus sp. GOD-11R]WPB58891.1 UDP-2,3-diacylglucosamine diphosphatase [Xylophilus sp. GOD-11R]
MPDVISTVAAPAAWQAVDFVSDLHLHADDPRTAAAFLRYLRDTPADAVFLLGDIFEVWIGDDAAQPGSFEAGIGQALKQAGRSASLYFMHGNRDFLLGAAFTAEAHLTLLDDPAVFEWHDRRWLLSHGDALCLADVDYQRFRSEVRSAAWQSAFLARPIDERRAIARGLRAESGARQAAVTVYADADPAMVDAWLDASRAEVLIHGHTHRPTDHTLPGGRQRVVLSDWDMTASPPRAEVLRLTADGTRRRLPIT